MEEKKMSSAFAPTKISPSSKMIDHDVTVILQLRKEIEALEIAEQKLKKGLMGFMAENRYAEIHDIRTPGGTFKVIHQERKTPKYDNNKIKRMLTKFKFWESVQTVDMGKVKRLTQGKSPLIPKKEFEECIGSWGINYAFLIKEVKKDDTIESKDNG